MVLVSVSVILPLALMKQLGESIFSTSVISSLSPPHESGFPCALDPVEYLFILQSISSSTLKARSVLMKQ